jgi:hypothetical protein
MFNAQSAWTEPAIPNNASGTDPASLDNFFTASPRYGAFRIVAVFIDCRSKTAL